MNDILKHRQMVADRILKSCGATTEDDDLEKARTGIYADNANNRRLQRVGQQYGSKKQEETPKGKEGKKGEPTNADYARGASDKALENAARSGNEEHRVAAKQEMERRKGEGKQKDNNKKFDVVAITELEDELIEGDITDKKFQKELKRLIGKNPDIKALKKQLKHCWMNPAKFNMNVASQTTNLDDEEADEAVEQFVENYLSDSSTKPANGEKSPKEPKEKGEEVEIDKNLRKKAADIILNLGTTQGGKMLVDLLTSQNGTKEIQNIEAAVASVYNSRLTRDAAQIKISEFSHYVKSLRGLFNIHDDV